jgi:hypothetical protein
MLIDRVWGDVEFAGDLFGLEPLVEEPKYLLLPLVQTGNATVIRHR